MNRFNPNHYYPAETANFLRIFARSPKGRVGDAELEELARQAQEIFALQAAKLGAPRESLTLDEQAFGLLHPVIIGKGLLKNLRLSEAEEEKITQILRKSFPVDPVTGFQAIHTMPVIMGLSQLCAGDSSVPVCLVEGDFTNMGGANRAIGSEATDKLLHAINAMVKEKLGAKAKEVQALRAGGDEVRLLVYGIEPARIQKILDEEIHPAVNLLSAKFGVHTIGHTKQNTLPGFGAAFAVEDFSPSRLPSQIEHELEKGIGAQKQSDARQRYGMTDEAGIIQYLQEFYIPALSAKNPNGEYISGRIRESSPSLRNLAAKSQEEWARLVAPGGAYHKLNLRYKAENSGDFFSRHRGANAMYVASNLDSIKLPEPENASARIPFWDETISSRQEPDPEMLRLRKAFSAFGFNELAQHKGPLLTAHTHELQDGLRDKDPKKARMQQLIVDAMQVFDAPNPAARCKSANLVIQDAQTYIDEQGGAKVLQLEVNNLNGLNKVGRELADSVLREVTKIITTKLEQRGLSATHVYYEGNGNYKVFLPPQTIQRRVRLVGEDIRESVRDAIANETVETFARNTYARSTGGREHESDVKISMLEKNLAEISSLTGHAIRMMSDIPHPKEPNNRMKSLNMGYHADAIGKGEDLMSAFKRIRETAEAKSRHDGKQR